MFHVSCLRCRQTNPFSVYYSWNDLFFLQNHVLLWMFLSTTTWALLRWCGVQQKVPAHTRLWPKRIRASQSPATPPTPTAPWPDCSAVRSTTSLWWPETWPATTLWPLHPTGSWQVCHTLAKWLYSTVSRFVSQFRSFTSFMSKCDPFNQNPAHLQTFKQIWHVNSWLQLCPGSRVTSLWVTSPILTTKTATTPPVLAQAQKPSVASQGCSVAQCTVCGSRLLDSSTTAHTAPWSLWQQVMKFN